MNKLTKYEAKFLVLFNTVTQIVGYSKSETDFKEFSQFIYDELQEYHQLFDKYNDYENVINIKTINDNANNAPVKVDRKIIDLLLYCKESYKKTNGKVNIAMGPVLEIWHDYRTAGVDNPLDAALPPMEKLQEASNYMDINKVIIDEKNSTVYFADDNMSLDVGAIAKGYATEQVTQAAIQNGYTDFLLSVGGNVRAAGLKGKEQELWSVGIQDPDKDSGNNSIFTLSVSNLSVVASGDYERYYTVNGKQYHHIIDPDTLMPSSYYTAISVITPDSADADALSTALYNMPYEESRAYADQLEDTEVLWIFSDRSMKYTDGFMDLVQD